MTLCARQNRLKKFVVPSSSIGHRHFTSSLYFITIIFLKIFVTTDRGGGKDHGVTKGMEVQLQADNSIHLITEVMRIRAFTEMRHII